MVRTHSRRLLIGLATLVLLVGIATPASSAASEPGTPKVFQAVNFMVVYNPSTCQNTTVPWPAEAQAALNQTVTILDSLVNSTPTIRIDACYENADSPDTLASAGPNDFFDKSTVPALPMPNIAYGVALANAISGVDNNGDRAEISLSVNKDINWNFNPALGSSSATQFDFVSTVLHELIHGLGFVDSSAMNNGTLSLGDQNGQFNVYDTFLVDNNGTQLITLPNNSQALADALQAGSGNLHWNGPNAIAANSNARPSLFAPNPYQTGSSISHLDDTVAANAGRLMNSATDAGPGAHAPSAVSLMMLKDMGWSVNEASDYGDLPAIYAMTTAAEDGARHIRDGLSLGASVTTENAGTPSDTATADTGDDGIALVGTWGNGANGGTLQATINDGRGCLSGWIDWNNNGTFDDAGEQVIAMQAVAAGAQTIQITVPDNTFNGATAVSRFARFRLAPDIDGDGNCSATDQQTLAPRGTVFGGEVEDYQLQFAADGTPTTQPPPTPQQYRVTLPLITK